MISPTILISEADVVGNKGAVAMVNCIIKGIQKHYPDAKFIVTSKFIKDPYYMDSENIEILYDSEQEIDIPLFKVWLWWLLNKVGLNLKSLLKDKVISKYLEADIILSASGISFNDNFGFIKIYHFSKYLQLPLFLEKKVIKFTQTLGPFESRYNKILSKLVLSNILTVMARGRHSVENLKKIGVEENVENFPDIAMTMETVFSDKALSVISECGEKTIIGFSPNIVCQRLDESKEYLNTLKELCRYIVKEHNDVHILFIPHTIEKSNLNVDDDYKMCSELSNAINDNSKNIVVNTIDYSPEEIKWLISKCDFYIGSRFHSLIASISSCVPSIAIGWHWKYNEMMEWVNLENNVIQYWDLTIDKLIKLFDTNFELRKETKTKLQQIVPEVCHKADSAINYIIENLDENN